MFRFLISPIGLLDLCFLGDLLHEEKESLPSYELSLYEKLYEKEIAYRNNFSDKVYKSIAVIISLLGANVWLITKFISVFNSEYFLIKSANGILIVVSIVLTCMIVIGFFNVLYNYKETKQNPKDIKVLLEEYKSLNDIDDNVTYLMNESLKVSYIDAAIKTYDETQKHVKLFKKVYLWIIIEVVVSSILFFIEILV